MPLAYSRGSTLGQSDLSLSLTDSNGVPVDAVEISYELYYVDEGPPEVEVLIPDASGLPRVPANPNVGEYYASVAIPSSAALGEYRIRWVFKQSVTDPDSQVVQVFAIVDENTQTVNNNFNESERELIRRLRIHLRDNNPDRNYRFMPPNHSSDIGAYNQVFGYVWEDEELYEYLRSAVDWWDLHPPATTVGCVSALVGNAGYRRFQSGIMWGAMVWALMALSINWVHEEFDYSIGGISLSLSKSGGYEGLKSNAEGNWQNAVEAKSRTVKYFKGLARPRFAGRGSAGSYEPRAVSGSGYPVNFSF
jgi:hypothetical protein